MEEVENVDTTDAGAAEVGSETVILSLTFVSFSLIAIMVGNQQAPSVSAAIRTSQGAGPRP